MNKVHSVDSFSRNKSAERLREEAVSSLESMTRYDHLKKTAEKLMQVQASTKQSREITGVKLKQAESLIQNQADLIQHLRTDRARISAVVQEQKKQYDTLKFEMLSVQALNAKIKQMIATFEEKLSDGENDRNNLRKKYQQEIQKLEAEIQHVTLSKAQLAQEFNQNKEQQRTLENGLHSEIRNKNLAIDSLGKIKETLENQLLDRSNMIEQLQQRCVEADSHFKGIEDSLSKTIQQLSKKIATIENDKHLLEEFNHTQANAINEKDLSIQRLEEVQKCLQEKIVEHEKEAITALQQVSAENELLKAQLQQTRNRADALDKNLTNKQAQLDDLDSTKHKLESENKKLQEEIQDATKQSNDSNWELRKLRSELITFADQNAQLIHALECEKNRNITLEEEIKNFQLQIEKLHAERVKVEEELLLKVTQISKYETTVKELIAKNEDLMSCAHQSSADLERKTIEIAKKNEIMQKMQTENADMRVCFANELQKSSEAYVNERCKLERSFTKEVQLKEEKIKELNSNIADLQSHILELQEFNEKTEGQFNQIISSYKEKLSRKHISSSEDTGAIIMLDDRDIPFSAPSDKRKQVPKVNKIDEKRLKKKETENCENEVTSARKGKSTKSTKQINKKQAATVAKDTRRRNNLDLFDVFAFAE